MGRLHISWSGAFVQCVLWTVLYIFCVSILLDFIYIYSAVVDTIKHFTQVLVPICTPTSNIWEFYILHVVTYRHLVFLSPYLCIGIANIFSHSVAYLFSQMFVCFGKERFLMLIKPVYQFFLIMLHTCCVIFKKPLPIPKLSRYMFLCSYFIFYRGFVVSFYISICSPSRIDFSL